MRAGLKAEYDKSSNIMTSSEVEATRSSVRSALEAMVQRVWNTEIFLDLDRFGKPSNAVIAICGIDKGGAQSSRKAALGCAIQKHLCRRESTILFGALPGRKDDEEAQALMADLFSEGIEDLRTDGVAVGGQQRPGNLILMGDCSFVTIHLGHAGPSCRMPCRYCTAWARPTEVSADLLEEYGNMEAGSDAEATRRTLEHAQKMAKCYQEVALSWIADPLDMTEHLSYKKALSNFHRRG